MEDIVVRQKEKEAPPPAPNEKKTKVVFMMGEKDESQYPVKVMVNGKAYIYQRGVEVKVPRSVLEVIDNAVETRYRTEHDPDDPSQVRIVEYSVPRFPYRIVGEQ